MVKSLLILFLFAFITISVFAQDIHFSQFNASPLNLNPALTSAFDGDLRVVANNKSQWMSFTNAYRTFSLGADARLEFLRIPVKNFNVGLVFNTDKAGDAGFGTNHVKLSCSYSRFLRPDSSLAVTAGLNGGFNQHSINYNKLTFGNQFDGNQFNSSLAANEVFTDDNFSYLDVTAGVFFTYIASQEWNFNMGIAFSHINKPKQSFYDVNSVNLDQKFTVHGGCEWKFSKDFTLYPSLVYFQQGRLRETNLGALLKVLTNNASFHAVYVGGWLRFKDAGIFEIRADYNNWNLGISYDINYSDLRVASNGRGGLELSVIYILKKYKPFKSSGYKKCPVYM